jgi:hypothetical protein
LRSGPGSADLERSRAQAGLAILHTPFFEAAEVATFAYSQELDEEGVLGRAFSASYAPKPTDPEAGPFADALRQAYTRFQQQGKVRLRYVTTVYIGRRSAGPESAS